jgi:hypothetical protein
VSEHTPKTFTKTGEFRIEAGLDQDGDLVWKSGFDGLTALEAVGALVVVGTRMVLRMVMPSATREDE